MSALLPVINHLIRQNPEHQGSLAHFAGRTLCINLPGLCIRACIGSSGFLEPTAGEAGTGITFRNSAVQRILQGGEPGVGDIETDSNLMLGTSLLLILGGLRYDTGDDLNRIFGETAAENISARATAIGGTVKQIGKSIAEQIDEFVREPESPVSDQATIAAWMEEADKLCDDIARLSARLDRFERDTQTRNSPPCLFPAASAIISRYQPVHACTMNSQFQNIGIVTRPNAPDIQTDARTLIRFLYAEKLTVFFDEACAEDGSVFPEDTGGCHITAKSGLGGRCDVVIVLGGDGTFLSVARKLAPHDTSVIGIDQEHLGFLTQVSRGNMVESLHAMLAGQYRTEERILLEVSLERDGEICQQSLVLNDAVIPRGRAGQAVEFEVFIDKELVYIQRSDGLIVSTPTGSTAYTLAADGPVLQAGLRALILVPIYPQSMTNRPIAIPDTSEIKVLITKNGDVRVYFGGQPFADIQNLDHIHIRRHPRPLRILHPTDYEYSKTLRQKLY